jgi:hypothetical protein
MSLMSGEKVYSIMFKNSYLSDLTKIIWRLNKIINT